MASKKSNKKPKSNTDLADKKSKKKKKVDKASQKSSRKEQNIEKSFFSLANIEDQPTSWKSILPVFTITYLFYLFMQLISIDQSLNGDAGFYLGAAKLASEGKIVYRDFFYPQAPLLPYYVGLFLKIFGQGIFVGRIAMFCSSMWVPVLMVLIFRKLSGGKESIIAIVAGLLVIAIHPWSYIFFTMIKGYSISMTAWLASFLFLLIALSSSGKKRLISSFATGFFISIVANMRAPYLLLSFPLIGSLIFSGVKNQGWKLTIKDLIAFSLGTIPPAIPSLILITMDYQSFMFNNMGYHSIRAGSAPFFNSSKNSIFINFFKDPFHLLLLLSLVPVLFACIKRKTRSIDLVPLISLVLSGIIMVAVCYMPNPIYIQYFFTLLPIFGLTVFATFQIYSSPLIRMLLAVLFIVTFSWKLPHMWVDQLQSHHGMVIGKDSIFSKWKNPGHMSTYKQWNYEFINEVAEAINNRIQPGEQVVSFWPGFVAQSKASFVPGMENHFGFRVSKQLTDEERKKYRITSPNEIVERLSKGEFRIVVTGQWNKDFFRGLDTENTKRLQIILGKSFKKEFNKNGVFIFVRK